MRATGFFVAAVLSVCVAGCHRKPPEPPAPPPPLAPAAFSGARALEEVRRLVEFSPRDAGTPGAEKAARHLEARLRELGVESAIDEFTDRSPKGDTVFRNVIGTLPGQGEGTVILASHYDTRSGVGKGFEGANDSGSSSGALLELARSLAASPPRAHETVFVFFDGEECMKHYGPADGLHGSRRLAAQAVRDRWAKDVKAFLLLDMVGDRDLTVTVPRNGTPALISAVFAAAAEEGVRPKFSLYPMEIGDDHEPFLAAGIPAVDLIDFQYGSRPGRNDYWHTPEDRMDKLSAESLETVGRVVIRVLNGLGE